MPSRTKIAALALAGLLGIAGCDGGESEPETETTPPAGAPGAPDGGPEAGQQMDPEMMAGIMEAQEIQQQLQPIREEAMQDQQLASELEELQRTVEAAMREENAELFDRMDGLEADFMAAQEAGDQERQQALATEGQAVDQELRAAQQEILERPDIRERVDAFEEAQRARMIEVDPEAETLLDRLDEIVDSLDMR